MLLQAGCLDQWWNWELAGNADFSAPLQTYWVRNSGVGHSRLCFNNPSRLLCGISTSAPLAWGAREISTGLLSLGAGSIWKFLLLLSLSVVSHSLWPCELQQARLPCPSLSPAACSNLCPLSQWCDPTISPSVTPFSSCLWSFSASGSFPVSRLFTSGGQSIGVSVQASGLPMNIQDWFP